MIARFRFLLPSSVSIPEGTQLKAFQLTWNDCTVRFYPPLHAAISPSDLDSLTAKSFTELGDLVRNAVPPTPDDRIIANGLKTAQANLLQIDFIKDEFDRTISADGQTFGSAYLLPIASQLVGRFIQGVRELSGTCQFKYRENAPECWRLQFLTDDEQRFEPKEGFLGSTDGGNFSYSVCPFTEELWRNLPQLIASTTITPWVTLLMDAQSMLPDVGPALVLSNTAIEILIARILNEKAKTVVLPEGLWDWINNRGDYRKEPSTTEQLDVLLKLLTGKTLKEDNALWEGYQQLRTARNSFVHEGKPIIGKVEVTPEKAAKLVGKARQIISHLEQFLPPALVSRTLKQPYSFGFTRKIHPPTADGKKPADLAGLHIQVQPRSE